MTAPGTLWPDVVDAVVDVLTVALGETAVVFDGPPPVNDASTLGVAVGMSSPDTVDAGSGTVQQLRRDAGPLPDAVRTETGAIECSAWGYHGDDFDFRTLRANVSGLLTGINTALAAIDVLGLPQITDLVILSNSTWVQTQTPAGTTVEAMFSITYTAVI